MDELNPLASLDGFLAAHALGAALPAGLFARGEALHDRLRAAPPADPRWGRFLVALGHLAADKLDDPQVASRFFLAALQTADHHGDHEAAVTAGYDLGVLQERRGAEVQARAAYTAAAREGFRLGCLTANTMRSAAAAVRLSFADQGTLDEQSAPLAKQAWLCWLWLRRHAPEQLDRELEGELGRQLCALLLPEDDPWNLAARWRTWRPNLLPAPDAPWRDSDPACLYELFAAAAAAADLHLAGEGPDPGSPYRQLAAAAVRQIEKR